MFAIAATICLALAKPDAAYPANSATSEPKAECIDTWLPGLGKDSGAQLGTFASEAVCTANAPLVADQWRSRFGSEYTIAATKCQTLPKPTLVFKKIGEGIYVHKGRIAASPAIDMPAVQSSTQKSQDKKPQNKKQPAKKSKAKKSSAKKPPMEKRGDISNIAIIIGKDGVVVIDTGGSFETGIDIWLAIRNLTPKPITFVALTHMHPDHIFGASVLQALGAKIIGHKNLERAIAERASGYLSNYGGQLGALGRLGLQVPKIDIAIGEDGADFNLGERKLRFAIWPLSHTSTDLTLVDEKTGTLFAGDLLFEQHIPAIDGSIRGWQKVDQDIAKWKVRQVVPGHGPAVLKFPQGLQNQERYFKVLVADTKAQLDKGARLDDAVKAIGLSERKKWKLFKDFNPRNATTVFSELEWE